MHVVDDDRHVEHAFEHRFDRTRRGLGQYPDGDPRVIVLEAREQRRQPVVAGVALRADADRAGAVLRKLAHVVFGALHFVEDTSGGREDSLAAGVSTIFLPSRVNSGVASRSSMSRSWWLSADCVRLRRSAARVTLPQAAMAWTSRRCRRSRSTA